MHARLRRRQDHHEPAAIYKSVFLERKWVVFATAFRHFTRRRKKFLQAHVDALSTSPLLHPTRGSAPSGLRLTAYPALTRFY